MRIIAADDVAHSVFRHPGSHFRHGSDVFVAVKQRVFVTAVLRLQKEVQRFIELLVVEGSGAPVDCPLGTGADAGVHSPHKHFIFLERQSGFHIDDLNLPHPGEHNLFCHFEINPFLDEANS